MSRTDHKPAGAYLSREVRAAPLIYINALEVSGRGEEVDGYHYGYI